MVQRDRADRPDAHNLLGRFLFSGGRADRKPVDVLSGGERRRLALARVVVSGANLLMLDEPTNHLDVESREALEAALDALPGTVLLVTHDRALLDAIAERTLAIEDGTIRSYDGGWAEMLAGARSARRPHLPLRASRSRRGPRPRRRGRPSELERLEQEIAACEAEVAGLEAKLAEDWGNVETLQEHAARREALRAMIARWEELFEQADAEDVRLERVASANGFAGVDMSQPELLPLRLRLELPDAARSPSK